ncbi:MAG TPA: phage holin family protein [Baekduia sp.]|nr:phage holin family protein [Baekduia sp.]
MTRVLRLAAALLIATAAVYVGTWVAPGVWLEATGAALAVAVVFGVLNAVLPPLLAALPLPYTFVLGFLLVLVLDGAMLWAAGEVLPGDVHVASVWAGILAALLIAAASIVICMLVGADDQVVALAVLRRVARRQGVVGRGPEPGLVVLEIDGLADPVLRRAMRSGHAPNLQRWVEEDGYRLVPWEPDLSSQTGASQAGILLGSNDDIPAFRWVEKETGRLLSCSDPRDCAEIERRHATGRGLLVDGGASRGNLLSGEADEVILTVSRLDVERRANPGYRAFLANGSNAARVLVLFAWDVALELVAAARQRRRDVRPRGHRGGRYPLLRATMTTLVRDLVVFGVLTDMIRGRPIVYATFASYDEVAHHSGLERPDTLEALRRLDERFGRVAAMRAHAPRPYEIVVLSDHGQTQGATFRQRHGYGLDELVERCLAPGAVEAVPGGDEQEAMVSLAAREAGAPAPPRAGDGRDVSRRPAVVLGSGNLGLVYLMETATRMTLEEIEARHPRLVETLRTHEHVGWVLVRSAAHGAVVLGPRGRRRLADGAVEGEDPLAPFGPGAERHLRRTDGFAHCPDLLVGSFYDPEREEGCAFEELISFHGGLGGPQTQPFLLHPAGRLPLDGAPIVGAEAVHRILTGWRRALQPAVEEQERLPVAGPAAVAAPAGDAARTA